MEKEEEAILSRVKDDEGGKWRVAALRALRAMCCQ
jgi:hypothetical protein